MSSQTRTDRADVGGAALVHALRSQRRSVNALAGVLGVPRSAVLSVLAGNARAGTVELVRARAAQAGWLEDDSGGTVATERAETDPAPAA